MAEPNSVTTPVVDAPVAAPTPAPQAPAPVAQAPALPQDTRDKTREQFDKLLESNRRLYESNESLRRQVIAREQSEKTFSPIQQVPTAPKPIVDASEFVETDPMTGESFINTEKMKGRMKEINDRASRAEQAIKNYIETSEKREIERQSNETFAVYPELNPRNKEKFNEGFNKQVRGVLLDSMYNPSEYGGQPLTFKAAADVVRGLNAPASTVQEPKKIEKKTDSKAQDNKAQGSAQVPSQPGNLPEPTYDARLQELRMKTRYGSDEALAERLKATEHIVPKEGSS